MSNNGKLPEQPHDVKSEKALLGSLVMQPSEIFNVESIVSASDFHVARHGQIYAAILSLHNRREAVDFVTLCEELSGLDQLDAIGGQGYLASLFNATPTSIHAVAYANIVHRTAIRRRLILTASDIARLAYDHEIPLDSVLDQAESLVLSIGQREQRGELEHIGPILSEYYDMLSSGETNRTVPTGFVDLDKLLKGGGLPVPGLSILAGRPSMGKSALLLSAGLNAARLEKRVALFSLEMSKWQIAERLASMDSRIDSVKFGERDLNELEWTMLTASCGRLHDLKLYVNDTPAVTPNQVRGMARRLQAQAGVDLILLDYLQLMRPGRKMGNREQEVAYLSQSLKALVREMEVPVLAACQLNRALEQRSDKRPMLADLRESGAIENDADVVMFIYRDDYYDKESLTPNIAEIITAKQRNGPTGVVHLFFRKSTTTFLDAEIQELAI